MNGFSYWSADAKNWDIMTLSSSEGLEAGISAITKTIVDGKENYYAVIEKKVIVAF